MTGKKKTRYKNNFKLCGVYKLEQFLKIHVNGNSNKAQQVTTVVPKKKQGKFCCSYVYLIGIMSEIANSSTGHLSNQVF